MTKRVPTTHVVVTCANRKRLPVAPQLSARTLRNGSVASRADEWIHRLATTESPVLPAIDLYAGEHWSVARSLKSLVPTGRAMSLWILSAGYGLVSSQAPLRPYSATFASGNPDSVASSGTRNLWWSALAEWKGPEPGAPRSLTQLAEQDTRASVVVALSAPYLEACSDDLAGAAAALSTPSLLSVICLGASSRVLGNHILPGDARLQHAVGGTRQALNVRVLAHLLERHGGDIDRETATRTLNALLARQPPLPHYDRMPSPDEDVKRYIRKRLRSNPSLSRSRLLTEFRDAGHACEQSRFARLFESASSTP